MRNIFLMAWRLNIEDKVQILDEEGNDLYCPPHTIPHKLPFTAPITNEPCHYHNSKLRMFHHIPFCYCFCKNYKTMIETYKKRNSDSEEE